jgi:hypothetical protein
MRYIILAESPDGSVGVWGQEDNAENAVIFDSEEEARQEVRRTILLQGLAIQIVPLKLIWALDKGWAKDLR